MQKSDIKILIVDDEREIRNLFEQALRAQGYQVFCAQDGQEALRLCSADSYQILLTDLNMPNMNGNTLLARVKERWPFMEVVMITGYGTIESAVNALKSGAADFILKPVKIDQVQFVVNRCFQKLRARHENLALRELNDQLRELNEMKDKFLAITNHEVRTPLTIMKGYLELLCDDLQNADPETREMLGILRKTCKELCHVADRMHVLARIHRSQLAEGSDLIDLRLLVRQISADMHGLFQRRHIALTQKLGGEPGLVRGEGAGLKLVVHELLENALKFTPDGGGVSVEVDASGDEVLCRVRDNGVGIPFDKQELIFKDFYELQETTHHKSSTAEFMGGGMGIGLSLVKEIVSGMGGKVAVDSEPGVGSIFSICLPRARVRERRYGNAAVNSV